MEFPPSVWAVEPVATSVRSTGQPDVHWGEPSGGWVDDEWRDDMTEGDVGTVLRTPGLTDVANLLGYEPSREAAAWQRRRPATD